MPWVTQFLVAPSLLHGHVIPHRREKLLKSSNSAEGMGSKLGDSGKAFGVAADSECSEEKGDRRPSQSPRRPAGQRGRLPVSFLSSCLMGEPRAD